MDYDGCSGKGLELEVCSKSLGPGPVRRRWEEAFPSPESSGTCSPDLEDNEDKNLMEIVPSANSTDDEKSQSVGTQLICEAHPSCMKCFSSVREYEEHYQQRHLHKCAVCKRSLPSAHILELHVLEAHDTLFSLMAERKPMLSCFLETCALKFWKAEERKDHCTVEHKFPTSFKFWDLIVSNSKAKNSKPAKGRKSGNDGKSTSKQNRDKPVHNQAAHQSSTHRSTDVDEVCNEEVPSVNGQSGIQTESMEIDKTLGKQKSKSKQNVCFPKAKAMPSQITFGHSASRSFNPKYSFGVAKPVRSSKTETTQVMDLDLSDIKNVLPTTNTNSNAE